MENLAKKIIQTAEIPPIPQVLGQIRSLADNPRTTSSQLEKIVAQEPALITQMLKMVNSAYYSLPRRVSSIGHAMILLGFSTVKSVASGMILIQAFEESPGLKKDFVATVWKHTLLAANLVKIFAYRENMQRQDDLFLSLMIHDVGYLVLSQYFKTQYEESWNAKPFLAPEDEYAKFKVSHVEVGAILIESWKFPETVTELVLKQHVPLESINPVKNTIKDHAYFKVCDALAYQTDINALMDADNPPDDQPWEKWLELMEWNWERFKEKKADVLRVIDLVADLFK